MDEEQYYILQKQDNDDDDDELIILRIPQPKRGKKRKTPSNNNNNKNNIKDYFRNLQSCTEKSILILTNKFGISENHFYSSGTNFYCPFHENQYKSKSPSARFTSKNHTFTCFSSNCTLKKTNNNGSSGFINLNSINLYKNLLTI